MTTEDIKKLPTLQEVVEQILQEEAQILIPNDKEGFIMSEFMNLPNNPKYKNYFELK